MDKYLKFDSEEAMLEAMRSAGLLAVDEVGNEFVPFYHNGTAIDVVGLIVGTPAVMNEDGNITTEATFVEGWHVNLRGDVPVGLKPYEIAAPATPAKVWA